MESTVGVALLGRGTVGGGVAELLSRRRSHIERRSGAAFVIRGIGSRERDPIALMDDPGVDVVIECIGGTDIALECIERALERRKHVVTANKNAIAMQGPRLRALAAAKGVTLRYEAAVASAVPIVSTLDGALAGDEIVEIGGILNGTCNFILSAMRSGMPFSQALAGAQAAGYAEADPRSDVEGDDAAHKLAILMQHAFGIPIVSTGIPRRGIAGLNAGDVRRARQHGYELKLLAYAKRDASGYAAEVGPALVPFAHPFAKIDGADNSVRLTGESSGTLYFSGPGAGRFPAAAAVLGDVIAALEDAVGRRAVHSNRAPLAAAVDVAPAFSQFPEFAGLPVLPTTTQGDTHVGYSSRSLSAI